MPAIRNARRSWLAAPIASAIFLAGSSTTSALVVNRCGTDIADSSGGGINLKQALAEGGVVSFDCGPNATIVITEEHKLTRSTYIEGNNNVTLDGANSVTMLSVDVPDVAIRVENIIVRRAGPPDWAPGILAINRSGFIQGRSDTTATLNHVRFLDSNRPLNAGRLIIAETIFDGNRGDAILGRDITLSNVRIRNNARRAIVARGGVVSVFDTQVSSSGSSLFQECRLHIERASFSSNASAFVTVPGGAMATGCETEIVNSRFTNNRSDLGGGAISITKSAPSVTIRGSQFEGNIAAEGGGAIALEGLAMEPRKLVLEWSVFRRNKAKSGGALSLGAAFENNDLLESRGVLFSDNEASSQGGAVAGANVTFRTRRSIFLRNRAPAGGALWLHQQADRKSLIANSLFVLNKSDAGTIQGSNARIVNTTIVGSEGAALVTFPQEGLPGDRAFHLKNSIIENSSRANCEPGLIPVIDEGHNLQWPGASCGSTITVAVAALDTFYAPIPRGAAHEAGDLATCLSDEVGAIDVYGEHRPQTDRCSIGAVEGDLTRIARSRRLHREPIHIPDAR